MQERTYAGNPGDLFNTRGVWLRRRACRARPLSFCAVAGAKSKKQAGQLVNG